MVLHGAETSFESANSDTNSTRRKENTIEDFVRQLKQRPQREITLTENPSELPPVILRITRKLWANIPVNKLYCKDTYAQPTAQYPLLSKSAFKRSLRLMHVPSEIRNSLRLVQVTYRGFDNLKRQGQIVIHKDLSQSVKRIFKKILSLNYSFTSIVLVSEYAWSDRASVRFNNTSAFNWRMVEDSNELSDHAFGSAIDINPWLNPWVKVGEENARYQPARPGTLTANSPIVKIFTDENWKWGGSEEWKRSKDWQHFYRPDIPKKYYGKEEADE